MDEGRQGPGEMGQGPSDSFSEGRDARLWRWVFFSGVVHLLVIWGLFVIPHPARRNISYPVYSVDLVGGEVLGGSPLSRPGREAPPKAEKKKEKAELQTEIEPVKAKKTKQEKAKAEVKEKPKEKTKPKEKAKTEAKPPSPTAMQEAAAKEKKKAAAKKEEAESGLPQNVREKLIQAALERVKARSESGKKEKGGASGGSGSGEGEGADAPGVGGRGGGIVKGFEFLRYRNEMLQRIKNSWTWVGRRSDLEVTVRFGVNDKGEIFGLKVIQPSGDASFDDSVFRAVKRASPLSPPPESYRKDFMDVELTFRPKDLGG